MDRTDSELRGVKGWLLLLCLALTVFDPSTVVISLFLLTDASRVYFEQHPAFFRLVLVSGVCRLALAVFSLYAGLSLWRVVPNGILLARRYFLAAVLYSVFSLFLPNLVGLPEDLAKPMAGEILFNAALTITYAMVWYLYLGRSRRVKATFSDKGDSEEGL